MIEFTEDKVLTIKVEIRYDEDGLKIKCCGCRRFGPDSQIRIDPYPKEIYDRVFAGPLCKACYQDSLDNI